MTSTGQRRGRVRSHDRVGPDGRTHRVKSHTRAHTRGLNTARARSNMGRAVREWGRRNRGRAVALGALAAAEVGAFLTVRGTALVVASVGLMLVGAAVTMRDAAPDKPARPHAARGPQRSNIGQDRERRRQQRLRTEQLEDQQREDRRQQALLDDYHRRRGTPAAPAPGHPGGRWPASRAEWEGAPDDHPHKPAAMAFYQERGPGYTGPVEWAPGEDRPMTDRDRRRQLDADDRERQARAHGPAWPDPDDGD